MRLNEKTLAEVIVRECDGKTKTQITAIMKQVVALLGEYGALGMWRRLARAIDAAWAQQYGASSVTVVSAHPLTPSARKAIEAHAQGADMKEIVDARLIGGAVVRVDNTRIDGSITGALMRLKNAMYQEV